MSEGCADIRLSRIDWGIGLLLPRLRVSCPAPGTQAASASGGAMASVNTFRMLGFQEKRDVTLAGGVASFCSLCCWGCCSAGWGSSTGVGAWAAGGETSRMSKNIFSSLVSSRERRASWRLASWKTPRWLMRS